MPRETVSALGTLSNAIMAAGQRNRAAAEAFVKTPIGKLYRKVGKEFEDAERWMNDCQRQLLKPDRVDALDSIMMARKALDRAEAAVRKTMS